MKTHAVKLIARLEELGGNPGQNSGSAGWPCDSRKPGTRSAPGTCHLRDYGRIPDIVPNH
jgi:hypothetical protein